MDGVDGASAMLCSTDIDRDILRYIVSANAPAECLFVGELDYCSSCEDAWDAWVATKSNSTLANTTMMITLSLATTTMDIPPWQSHPSTLPQQHNPYEFTPALVTATIAGTWTCTSREILTAGGRTISITTPRGTDRSFLTRTPLSL